MRTGTKNVDVLEPGSSIARPLSSKCINVTAIGSCRITNPLKSLSARKPMRLNQTGVYGYSHSSAEILSHLQHLLNGTRPPLHLSPLLGQGTGKLSDELHIPSDLYIFELSSGKEISIDGHPVQLNYLNRHFRDFFSDVARTRTFWNLARKGDDVDISNFLTSTTAFKKLSKADQCLLVRVRQKAATLKGLIADIERINALVPKTVFVTHFDAKTPDGTLLKSRNRYLEMLRAALLESNACWFDPSKNVSDFGQKVSLEDTSTSLSHYSKSFETFLGEEWWRRYIRPTREYLHSERIRTSPRTKSFSNPSTTPPQAAELL